MCAVLGGRCTGCVLCCEVGVLGVGWEVGVLGVCWEVGVLGVCWEVGVLGVCCAGR